MSNIVELSSLFHRSKDRILELGEVFTPEQYVEGMLDVLTAGKRNFWNNEELNFFEPTCGHGNIVLAIYRRRLESLFKKAETSGEKNPAFYSVANALNSIWAIDIDSKNIQNCRTRLLVVSLEFLKSKTTTKTDYQLFQKHKDFFAHILCALRWHIHENECLSALSQPSKAQYNSCQTRIGSKWLESNSHREIDFDLSWASYYRSCEKEKVAPLDFERSQKFITQLIDGAIRGFNEFDFAKFIIADKPTKPAIRQNAVMGV
jgi:hypothetical protein